MYTFEYFFRNFNLAYFFRSSERTYCLSFEEQEFEIFVDFERKGFEECQVDFGKRLLEKATTLGVFD